jgi:hypothetical protein
VLQESIVHGLLSLQVMAGWVQTWPTQISFVQALLSVVQGVLSGCPAQSVHAPTEDHSSALAGSDPVHIRTQFGLDHE